MPYGKGDARIRKGKVEHGSMIDIARVELSLLTTFVCEYQIVST